MAKNDFDDRRGARNLGFLGRQQTVKGALGISNLNAPDYDDYYKFGLKARSSVSLTLKNLKANADLRLIGSDGNALATSRKRGKKVEKITKNLDPGNYYVLVSQDGVNTSYSLTLAKGAPTSSGEDPDNPGGSGDDGGLNGDDPPPFSASKTITPSPEPGSIPATAFNVGNINGEKAYKDTVGGADAADFYRFNVTRSSKITVSTGDVVDGSVETRLIYDVNGNDFVDAGDVIASGEYITKALGAGTYFVGVTASSGNKVTYTVKLEEDEIKGLNNTNPDPSLGLGGAKDLGALQGALNIKQVIGSSDTSNPQLVGTFESTDIYKFTLNSISNFSVLLNSKQLTGDVTMSLIYDDDGNGIANPGELKNGLVVGGNFIGGVFTGSSAGGSALTINKTLGAGAYYIAVTQRKVVDNTTYDLNLFVNNTVTGITPATDPGSSMGSAFDIGSLNRNISYKQFVGSVDGSDFYRFTIDQPRNIIIRYNGTPEQVALRFGQDLNGNGVFDPREDLDDNGRITFNEDLNNNGILDPGEDKNQDGYLERSEDRNLNGILEPNEVFEQQLSGDVVYSPLPPFYSSDASFNRDPILNGFYTTVSTDIYAKLSPGTYFIQVDPQATVVDLGDSLSRYGSANVLYNLSFMLDG